MIISIAFVVPGLRSIGPDGYLLGEEEEERERERERIFVSNSGATSFQERDGSRARDLQGEIRLRR